MPPTPQAHGAQSMPYVPVGHEVQKVPFGERPAGHVLTQVKLEGTYSWPTGQATHALAVLAHVRQLGEHGWQSLLRSG